MAEAQVQTAATDCNDFLTGLESLQHELMDMSEGLKWIGEQTLDLEAGAGCACLGLGRHLGTRADDLEGLIHDVRRALGAEVVSHV